MNKKLKLMKNNKNMYVDKGKKFLMAKNHHPKYALVCNAINMKL